ncbi:hypothetical protein DFA_02756 [Cavenderia fasciculata]|uniref:LIM zinc-binding domain-containing protein n=1 Tax=Cavenderia fasciculata TaxID=261658 RepID=F4PI26_CACFS|nr:uncharacterized protein DFA_02756 [Cavenderia fasciculata]EGG24513.1 hypothetical protein DFA_02756 [Cavenderia fasciculata]|eukprot:XP_004362364.1 hypothetical protein DFA_02756 [Cavenderia fasciculata]
MKDDERETQRAKSNIPLGEFYFEIDRLPYCELDFKKPRGPVTPIKFNKPTKPSSFKSSASTTTSSSSSNLVKKPTISTTTTKPSDPSLSNPSENSNNQKQFTKHNYSTSSTSTSTLSPTPSSTIKISVIEEPDKASLELSNQSHHHHHHHQKEQQKQQQEYNQDSNKINSNKSNTDFEKINIDHHYQQQQVPIIVNSVSISTDNQFDKSLESILDSMEEMSHTISSPYYLNQPKTSVASVSATSQKSHTTSNFNKTPANSLNNIQDYLKVHDQHQQKQHQQHQSHQHNQQHGQQEQKSEAQEYNVNISIVEEPKAVTLTKSPASLMVGSNVMSVKTSNHNNFQPLDSSSSSSSSSTKTTGEMSLQHIHPYSLSKGNSIGSGGSGDGMQSYTVSYVKDNGTTSFQLESIQCHKCRKEIWDKMIINSIGDRFHPSCFTCYICRTELYNAYHTDENGYLCSPCQIILNDRNNANRKANGFCSTCYKRFGNGEQYVQIDSEKYHKDCFKCCSCKSVIKDQNYSKDRVTMEKLIVVQVAAEPLLEVHPSFVLVLPTIHTVSSAQFVLSSFLMVPYLEMINTRIQFVTNV